LTNDPRSSRKPTPARATFELSDLRFTAYVTDATNESCPRTVNALRNAIAGFAGMPRIYGLKVGYSF
jgi:hypothetical protein